MLSPAWGCQCHMKHETLKVPVNPDKVVKGPWNCVSNSNLQKSCENLDSNNSR